MANRSEHEPVLLKEVIDALSLRPGMFVIDATIDGGGHAKEILRAIGESGKLLGVDWDPELLEQCRARLGKRPNLILKHGNYADLPAFLEEMVLPQADVLLLDLGFSSAQLEGKGMSFEKDEPLTMTYSPDETPLMKLLQSMREEELAEVIRELGEERYAARIAHAIYVSERRKPIVRTGELAEVVRSAVPENYERGRIDPATRTFQALRIYANDELGNLRRLLANLPKILKSGGRVAIISFHSLEDRIVKQEFRKMADENILKILTKKPIEATEQEIYENPRARSAKLRAAQLI